MQVGVSVPEETVVRLRKLKPEKQSLSSFIKELMDLGLESYEISSFSPDAAAEVTPAMEGSGNEWLHAQEVMDKARRENG